MSTSMNCFDEEIQYLLYNCLDCRDPHVINSKIRHETFCTLDRERTEMSHHKDHGCCSSVGGSGTQQTLDELAFERGIWTAAIDNDVAKINRILTAQGRDHVNAKDRFVNTTNRAFSKMWQFSLNLIFEGNVPHEYHLLA